MNFLRIRTSSQLKKNKAQRDSTSYQLASRVGVLFSVDTKEKHEQIKEFVKKLEKDGKKVQVMSFLPSKKDNYEFLFDFFTTKDVSFWGKLTSAQALKFVDEPFDYLFCLDTKQNDLILNLLARSKAKCRIGKYNRADQPYFEFMIDAPSNTKNLIDGMYKYASQLR